MATSCELVREDNGQWVPGAGGNIYHDSGRNNPPLPIPVGLDLRYSADLSDQEDRRTSSCSPESCELPSNDGGATPYKAPDAFGLSTFKQSVYSNYIDGRNMHCGSVQMPIQDWSVCPPGPFVPGSVVSSRLRDFESSTRPPYQPVNSKHIRNKTKSFDENSFAFTRGSSPSGSFPAPKLNRTLSTCASRPPVFSVENVNKQNGACVDKLDGHSNRFDESRKVAKNRTSLIAPKASFSNRSMIDKEAITKHTKSKSRDTPPDFLIQTNLRKRARSEMFGENDAAEALLVLSESFYQTSGSPKSGKVSPSSAPTHSNDDSVGVSAQKRSSNNVVQCNSSCQTSTTHSGYTSTANCDLGNTQADNSGTQQCSDTSTNSSDAPHGHKHPKLHFKKFICRKFVDSLDRETDEIVPKNEPLIPASKAASLKCDAQKNGDAQANTTANCDDDLHSNSNKEPLQPASAAVKDSKSVMDATAPPQVFAKDIDAFNTIKPLSEKPIGTNSKSIDQDSSPSSNKKQKPEEHLPRFSKSLKAESQQNKKTIASDTTCKFPTDKSAKPSKPENKVESPESLIPLASANESTGNESNLYRVSASLGSSSESLCTSENDINDPTASDPSSDSESDESDQPDSDDEITFDVTSKRANASKFAPKRKAFVLNTAKFSLPSKEQNKSGKGQLGGRQRSSQSDNKLLETANISLLKTEHSAGNGSFSSLKQLDSRATEPVKQSGIHIKKAVFTFSSLGKQDKTSSRQNGLKVTSQSAALADEALCVKRDETSFKFDKEKLGANEPVKRKQSRCENETNKTMTFGKFHDGDSFETLSKPESENCKSKTRKKRSLGSSNKSLSTKPKISPLPYDKHRLPRPSARPAALEAQQLIKCKPGRKRMIFSHCENTTKQNSKPVQKVKVVKRPKSAVEPEKKRSACSNLPTRLSTTSTCTGSQEKIEQNGDTSLIDTNISSGTLGLSKSSSRRKPARVFKHQKYTSVSMMSSTHSPRDLTSSTEFAIVRKPLSLDHRVLLANSIDPDRCLHESSDSGHSMSMTSSSCSSRTSSLAGDDNDGDTVKKIDTLSPDMNKHRLKRHRHRSAIENTLKSDFLKRKHKLKRLLSVSDQNSQAVRLLQTNLLHNPSWTRGHSAAGSTSSFSVLSLFPAPASLRPGHALGELLPGYGPSVSGQRSTLPLRWKKGGDITDLKQKRQRAKWRNLTIDMFCMGAKSKRSVAIM